MSARKIREGDHVEFACGDNRGTGTVSILSPDGHEYGIAGPAAEIFLDEGGYTAVPIENVRRTP